MASPLLVVVQDLGGEQLEKSFSSADAVARLREFVVEAWGLDPRSFRLLVGGDCLDDAEAELGRFAAKAEALDVQLLKFDPLLGLGDFDMSNHDGIELLSKEGEHSTLVKTHQNPDSNNVFLHHPIREPCFAEFEVEASRDELSFGITYDKRVVEEASGFVNLGLKNTWLYSKKKSMPTLILAGDRVEPAGGMGVRQGDRVAVYVDPQERLVKFYRNGQLVASNLPASPLPEFDGERPLWMYVMVDAVGDTIHIVRFGPGHAYQEKDSDAGESSK